MEKIVRQSLLYDFYGELFYFGIVGRSLFVYAIRGTVEFEDIQ